MDETAEQRQLIAADPRPTRKRPPPAQRANDLDGKRWLQNSISIWSDIAKSPEETALKHPAMFPAQLVSRLVESFTRSDQTVVLDPFCGIGATVLAAEMMGKRGIGLDISADYISIADRRPALNSGLFEETDDIGRGDRRLI
jgi:DNA modification methylase